MAEVLVLGAEAQAASSLAVAYPEHSFVYVSDRDILDGGDLTNVRIAPAARAAALQTSCDIVVALSARWLPATEAVALTQTFARLQHALPGVALPLRQRPAPEGKWIAKGDRWHRPDNPLSGTADELADVTDPHGCGLVFQDFIDGAATFMAIGRREDRDRVQVGIVRVRDERFFRDDVLQAAESVTAPEIETATLRVLDALDHRGWFTLNWLKAGDGLRLSSFRPAPRAIFGMFRRGGVDLLAPCTKVNVVPAGIRIIASPTYVSFSMPAA